VNIEKRLLEEDDWNYNENNRKRVMTTLQIMKYCLTGKMDMGQIDKV
jgi:hypothetical protein